MATKSETHTIASIMGTEDEWLTWTETFYWLWWKGDGNINLIIWGILPTQLPSHKYNASFSRFLQMM